ncbi:hypothetical protein ACFOET_11155 [Parapedobacter deserti]|uniref:Uncharacterized protein n=1 Tax=Parapedobacter deserti TaxID=1912957 RepID=A0ABV7JJ92_9SPHI
MAQATQPHRGIMQNSRSPSHRVRISLRSVKAQACGSMARVHWGIFQSPNPFGAPPLIDVPHMAIPQTGARPSAAGAAFPASMHTEKQAHFRRCLPLSHPEREKGGLSRDRGIKRSAASIYAAKALYCPSFESYLCCDGRLTLKARTQNQ